MQPDVDKILFANGCLSIRSGRHFWISIMQQLTSSPSIVLFYTKNLVSSQPEPKRQKKKTDKGLFFCIRVRKFLLPKRAVIQWSQVKNYSVLKSQFQLKTIQNFYSRKISFDSIIMHICIIQSKLPVLPGPTVGHTLRWSGAKNVELFTIFPARPSAVCWHWHFWLILGNFLSATIFWIKAPGVAARDFVRTSSSVRGLHWPARKLSCRRRTVWTDPWIHTS